MANVSNVFSLFYIVYVPWYIFTFIIYSYNLYTIFLPCILTTNNAYDDDDDDDVGE